ncbi:hypothetical protein [Sulfurimonas sp.]|uniref:hypothetical protein n=1 Tax=Sulfurimonas sp. TaxID=2022749 RepID=UPI0025EACE3D|nr:hypothetical protein [Sulfurimonas sp.]MDD5157598.1 hypothetical protein [Sulfurimonas sp.]
MLKKIGIVGCGWLGQPLATLLSQDFAVECFVRNKIEENSSFWQNDIIIVAINTKDNYLVALRNIAKLTNPASNIILMSSTSVYKEFNNEINESVEIKGLSLQKEAEDLMSSLRDNLLILRLGGLMGDDRVAGKWKSISAFEDGKVNYIHKDDVINITKIMIEKNIIKGIYNLVAPIHPLRSKVHEKNSKDFGFEFGSFSGMTNRVVSSQKLIKELDYNFLYPNPLEFWSK